MNRNFFIFVLLATLSMFNADDEFRQCSSNLILLDVKMRHTEVARFDISATLSNDITNNTQVLIVYKYDDEKDNEHYYKACGEEGRPDCPIPSGTQFTITIDSVPVQSDYNAIYVLIGDDPNYNPYGCAIYVANPVFLPCDENLAPLSVIVSDNPPPAGLATYQIGGTIPNDITEKTLIRIEYGYEKAVQMYKACGDGGRPNCPIPKGTQFSLIASSTPVPDGYISINVLIVDPTDGSNGDSFIAYACQREILG